MRRQAGWSAQLQLGLQGVGRRRVQQAYRVGERRQAVLAAPLRVEQFAEVGVGQRRGDQFAQRVLRNPGGGRVNRRQRRRQSLLLVTMR